MNWLGDDERAFPFGEEFTHVQRLVFVRTIDPDFVANRKNKVFVFRGILFFSFALD